MQSALEQLRLNDYMSLVVAIAVSYDYCLAFSKEVTLIWQRPWTKVSTIFLFIRYLGLLSALIFAFAESSFIPGPIKILNNIRRDIIYLVGVWARAIFFVSADVMMILRVYAMYNQSRIILSVLLVVYITEVVLLLISSSVYSNSKYATTSILQLPGIAICGVTDSTQIWNVVSTITQFVLGTVLCIFAITKFVRESLEMYRVTRQWQLNRYMGLLARDGVLYFLVTLLNSLLNMLGNLGVFPLGWVPQMLVVANVPLYTLTPRFVMNVRELYVLNIQGRWDRDIDSGFGLSSAIERAFGGTIGIVALAEDRESEELNNEVEIAVVELRAVGGDGDPWAA